MKKKKAGTVYLGGEWDEERKVVPKDYDLFLSKKWLSLTLLILFTFAVVLIAWIL